MKVTLSLREDQIIRLDRLAIDIRASTGAIITRDEALLAIIDAILRTALDTTSVSSED